MKAIELAGDIDDQHRLKYQVPQVLKRRAIGPAPQDSHSFGDSLGKARLC